MKIVIAGTGYVGLVSGTCFSQPGVDVVCVDEPKIRMLNEPEEIQKLNFNYYYSIGRRSIVISK